MLRMASRGLVLCNFLGNPGNPGNLGGGGNLGNPGSIGNLGNFGNPGKLCADAAFDADDD